jgi:kumamolisin
LSKSSDRVGLPGSERDPLPGARPAGAADPTERISVTVVVRPRQAVPEVGADEAPRERRYLAREDFAARHGAHPDDLAAVAEFARAHDLQVVTSDPARRSIVLSGTVAAFNAAFGVQLTRYDHPTGSYRGRTGAIHVPTELAPVITGLFGLDNRPAAQPHFRPSSTAPAGFTATQVAALYAFPSKGNGAGQTIALIELGGGYTTADLSTYFTGLGVAMPTITAVSVDGGKNQPTGDANGPDGEVMLDIEVAGAVAPGAHLVVYFAPNTDQGFLDAVTTAVHDTTNKPTVLSISWGSAESGWTSAAMTNFDAAFTDAAALGVSVCVAAGDNGSADSVTDGKPHVDFPASSPHVLACGGTELKAGTGARISSEVVWNSGGGATGGGVSSVFSLPAWQSGAGVPGGKNRGVPDVAGDADPETGYRVRVDGQDTVIGGTSAVAPLWAGLIALLNQQLGHPVGLLNPLLYAQPAIGTFRAITQGSNDVSHLGLYTAGPGWNACTGLGTPDGTALLAALSRTAAPGT